MQKIKLLLTFAIFLALPNVSLAFSQTFSNGQTGTVTIPAGVTMVSFYAKGGNGGNACDTGYHTSSGYMICNSGQSFSGQGGGGGSFASSPSAGYIVAVGGGGGDDFENANAGGAGGSTAGSGVGLGGGHTAGLVNTLISTDGTKNGMGGGADCSKLRYSDGSTYAKADGTAPGAGGAAGDGVNGGNGGYEGNTDYTAQGGGGGGGGYYGGGGGCQGDSKDLNSEFSTGGGGGSSYFHASLSAPDANGYVSIPVSVTGTSISLVSGTGGVSHNIRGNIIAGAGGGTITISWTAPTTVAVNGSCNSTNTKAFAATVTAWPSTTACSAGTGTLPIFPTAGSSTSWTCAGSGGGSTASCSASKAATVAGSCGTTNGTSTATAPTTGLCTTGTSSAVTTGTSSYTWTCAGNTTASCSANKTGQSCTKPCGGTTASGAWGNCYLKSSVTCGSTCSSVSSQGFCNSGSWTTAFAAGSTNASCTVAACVAVNGACNSTNTKSFASTVTAWPSTTACSAGTGTLPTFPATGASASWTCAGSGGGSTASCSASKTSAAGACGVANGISTTTAPTSGFCKLGAGTPSAVTTGTTSYTWTCSGSTLVSCSAPRTGVQSCTKPCGGTTASEAWGSCYSAASVACGSLCSSVLSSGYCNNGVWTTAFAAGSTNASCTVATCVASVNGACGTANSMNRTYAASETGWGAFTACVAGTSIPVLTSSNFPAQGTSFPWTCPGSGGGGLDKSCSGGRASACVIPACAATAMICDGTTCTDCAGPHVGTKNCHDVNWREVSPN